MPSQIVRRGPRAFQGAAVIRPPDQVKESLSQPVTFPVQAQPLPAQNDTPRCISQAPKIDPTLVLPGVNRPASSPEVLASSFALPAVQESPEESEVEEQSEADVPTIEPVRELVIKFDPKPAEPAPKKKSRAKKVKAPIDDSEEKAPRKLNAWQLFLQEHKNDPDIKPVEGKSRVSVMAIKYRAERAAREASTSASAGADWSI